MSGPKCDEYILEEELAEAFRATLLAQYRQQEEERLRLEEERRRQEEEERRRIEEARRKEEEERLRLEEEERRLLEEERRRQEEERLRRIQERADFAEVQNADVEARFQAYLEEMYKRKEQEYIAQAIDETLEEMGYEMVASMTPKMPTDQLVQAQVYEFEPGVGIQVLEANGQVSMEVVGIGTNNRFPTEQEKSYLKGQMERFCDAYDVLNEKLAARGVVKAVEVRHNKPDLQFARILNVSSFETKKEVETLQTVMRQEEKRSNTEEKQNGVSVGKAPGKTQLRKEKKD